MTLFQGCDGSRNVSQYMRLAGLSCCSSAEAQPRTAQCELRCLEAGLRYYKWVQVALVEQLEELGLRMSGS